jgi:hypothetical protein
MLRRVLAGFTSGVRRRFSQWLELKRRAIAAPPRTFLRLESLEDRLTPADLLYIAASSANDALWSDGANWVNMNDGTTGAAPKNNDTVTIQPGLFSFGKVGSPLNNEDDILNLQLSGLTMSGAVNQTVTIDKNLTVAGGASLSFGTIWGLAGSNFAINPVAGTFSWTGGTLAGNGTTITLGSSLTTNLTGGGAKALYGVVTLLNLGTINWVGGDINSTGIVAVTNGGVIDIQNDASWLKLGGNTDVATIVNQGNLRKTAGAGGNQSTTIAPDLDNQGNLQISAGTLYFSGKTKQSGANANTQLANGLLVWTRLDMTAGSLTGTGFIRGDVNNTGGSMIPTGLITLTGNYTQGASGTYVVNIDNLGNYGSLIVQANPNNVGGTVTLAGTLRVNRNAAYKPATNTLLFPLKWVAVAGDFTSESIPNNSWNDPNNNVLVEFVAEKTAAWYDLKVQPQ